MNGVIRYHIVVGGYLFDSTNDALTRHPYFRVHVMISNVRLEVLVVSVAVSHGAVP